MSNLKRFSRKSEQFCIWLIVVFFSATSFATTSASIANEPAAQSGKFELTEEVDSFNYSDYGQSPEIEHFDDDPNLLDPSDIIQKHSRDRILFSSPRLSLYAQSRTSFKSRAPPQI